MLVSQVLLLYAATAGVIPLQAKVYSLAEVSLESAITDLPPLHEFKSDPYITVAVRLQSLGKEKAIKVLTQYSYDLQIAFQNGEEVAKHVEQGMKVIILCRMLFVAKPMNEFRPPGFGAFSGLGNTEGKSWPLEPIALVDGVPFSVLKGYTIAGAIEMPKSYLAYCIKSFDWNAEKYKAKSADEKAVALKKLVKIGKWKDDLTEEEIATLAAQVK